MTPAQTQDGPRFPWGYFVATLIPIALIVAVFALPRLLGPKDSMGPAMLCSLLIGPAGGGVVFWGVFRLWRGDGESYPALKWLVCVPLLVGLLGFALG